MQVVITLVLFILFALAGLAVWAASDRPLAVREIALNTRRDGQEGTDYIYLKILSILYRVFAVVVWNVGLLLMILANLGDLTWPL